MSENFDQFIENIKEETEETKIESNNLEKIEDLGKEIKCEICGYKPRAHCKDPKKALENHINKHHNIVNLEPKKQTLVETVAEINNIEDIAIPSDEIKKKLVEDIEILRHKFPDITYNPKYSYPESSVETLERIKNTYIRIISDKAGSTTAFNMLIMASRGLEKITDSFGVADLEGFSGDIMSKQEEIIPILKEMVDLGIIESSALTPEIKLLLVLGNIAVYRMETNRIQKNDEHSGKN